MFAAKDTLLTRPSGGYTITRSVRLRSSASAYFNRTLGVSGDLTTWTWSAWVKRGKLGVLQKMLGTSYTSSSEFYLFFDSSDRLQYGSYTGGGGNNFSLVTSQVFRDPSAWYHIVFVWDTTQGTSSNRIKIYVNGVQVTAFASATYPSPSYAGIWNSSTHTHYIGSDGSSSFFDSYLTEINFINAQALTPSSFGETNAVTGVWQPKKYSGTYGTNGFYLNFSDNSAATATTIGKDYSGNGNNWTPNGISVTAGATNDSLVDVPTLDGIDTGIGGQVRGNYAVWNPLTAQGLSITYSNANLAMNWNSSSWRTSPSTFSLTSGKWYAESEVTQLGTATAMLFGASTVSGLSNGTSTNLGDWSGSISIGKGTGGAIFAIQGSYPTAPQTIGSGDYNLVAIDCDNGKAWLGYYDSSVPSTTWYSSAGAATGNPATGANPTMTFTAGTEMVVAQGIYNTSTAYNANFGQRTWVGTCPSGFKALCTQNLPASTINNGANHMAATTYTGTGVTGRAVSNAVNGTSMQPDLVWVKSRSSGTYNELYDSVRGVSLRLFSNDTAAEADFSPYGVTAFSSGGFTVSDITSGGYGVNENAVSYIGWSWKGGGTAVSNTSGTITSTVSANTTAGFSVVTYISNGVNGATIGHGLGVAPSMVIVKTRYVGTTQAWAVYHASTGATQYLLLNSTAAAATSSTYWNNTAPSSTVFTIGTSNDVNINSSVYTYVAYCFAAVAGYSAIGSYTGNGSTDGPFVYTGFRPRWIMTKCSSAGGLDWHITDTSRYPTNSNTSMGYLDANTAGTDGNYNTYDGLSNGFKIRDNGGMVNTNGGTYIYMAFAENPFKFSLAR